MKKIDSHVHFGPADDIKSRDALYHKMMVDMDSSGIGIFSILVAESLNGVSCSRQLDDALWFKAQQPERVRVFGGLFFDNFNINNSVESGKQLVDELEGLFAVGCDGLKMLLGKPDSRKKLGIPLDDPILTPLFTKLEETKFPIVWHIGDPEEFWDSNPADVPQWAHGKNWTYDDTHPSYLEIKAEAENVFSRHSGLNLVLPHFYFMSGDLKEAALFLDRHPNISIDTAPGVEMCHNCSAKLDEAREFFIKYDNRILFGTDCGMDSHNTSLKRSQMIQNWLETDGVVMVPADDPCMMPDVKDRFNGLALPEDSLQKIYADNFLRILGK